MCASNSSAPTSFEDLLNRKNDQVGLSLLLILSWISASDGNIDEQEKKDIFSIAAAGNNSESVPLILSLAKRGDLASIQLACEVLRVAFTGERAKLLMELAIGIAISDRFLLPSENHILRFLADLLGVSPSTLNDDFERNTGKPLPNAPDVSTHEYWYTKQQRNNSNKQESKESSSSERGQPNREQTKTAHSYATLGLEHGASKEEIKNAYRRLAKVHHPDRFHSLGDEAVEAAHVTFTRIQNAYNHLYSNA